MTALRIGSATDVGLVRANNQDRLLVAEPLFAVADGMGGHAAGEVASATAVDALEGAFTELTPEGLQAAARAANRAVWDHAQTDPELRGMGTTLVALALVGPPGAEELAVANVGDSRLYLLSQGDLVQVTSDHSLVAELVAEGQIEPEEAEYHPQRHVLTRALGVDADVAVDLLTVALRLGDRYLLCSDGLSREVTDDQVASILRRLADPAEAAMELVTQAKEHGGNDNITVVIVDVVDDGDKEARASATPVGDPGLVVPTERGKEGDEPTTQLSTASPSGQSRPGWWSRRRARRRADPTTRLITLRVVLFFTLLLALIAVAFGGVAYYARESYYVGLQGKHLVIYQGRPGGVLWFKPTVAERPTVTTAQVLPRHLGELQAGKQESSLGAARQYVANLRSEYRAAHSPIPTAPATTSPPTTSPATSPTTVAPATVAPTSVPPTTAVSGTPSPTVAPTSGGAAT
jgi:serine/threonine protein phosphatase PrpC